MAVPPHSQRVYGELWQNGAFIEVLCYEQPQPGEDESDRIHLMITDCDGKRRGWLMNIEDAGAIMKGLGLGIKKARVYGIPARPPSMNSGRSFDTSRRRVRRSGPTRPRDVRTQP